MRKNNKPAKCPNCKRMLVYTVTDSKCILCGWVLETETNIKGQNGSIKKTESYSGKKAIKTEVVNPHLDKNSKNSGSN